MTGRALPGLLLCMSIGGAAIGGAADRCDGLRLIDVAAEAGIVFTHVRGGIGERHLPETMGAGAAWLDYDGDGRLDLYVVQSGPFPPQPSAGAPNRLFRNRGDGSFEEVEGAAGADDRGYGQGVAAADVDGDGDTDLYLCNYGLDRLLLNRGDGSFEARPIPDSEGWSSSAAFADGDGDGDLDLYVARYVEYDPGDDVFCGDPATGERKYCDPTLFRGAADGFYLNRGDGNFDEAGGAAGLAAERGRGLGVVFTDLDADGAPDLYVANDLTINLLYRNRGDGTFESISLLSGAGLNRQGKAEAGMGVAAGDVDQDGDLDLAVSNFDVETNTLYVNQGELRFEDRSAESGFGVPSFNLLGFGLILGDLDLDRDLDAYVANGHIYEKPPRETTGYEQPDLLLLGDGRGGFEAAACGPAFESRHVGRGLATADYDDDGDLDLVVTNNGGPLQLLRNDLPATGWIGLRLVGRAPNTEAIGAQASLVTTRGAQLRRVAGGDSYQSSSDRRLLFALPAGDEPLSLELTWPSGARSTLSGFPRDRYLTVDERSDGWTVETPVSTNGRPQGRPVGVGPGVGLLALLGAAAGVALVAGLLLWRRRARPGRPGAATLVVCLLSILRCAEAEPPREPAQTDPVSVQPADEVRQELEAICQRIRSGSNDYYGRAIIDEYRGFLDAPVAEAEPRAVLRARLGMELLRVGENGEAAAMLAEAVEIAEEAALERALVLDIRQRLGLAQVRVGETSNCIGMHGPASCILPFDPSARHDDPRGSLAAIEEYRAYLAEDPANPLVAWMLNVAAMTVDRHPEAVPPAARLAPGALLSDDDVGRFPEVAWQVGVRVNQSSGGAVLDDFDGDGLLDVVTSTIDPCLSMTFHRNDGAGRFEDRTEASGLADQLGGLNLIHADYDNDGDIDLFVLRGGWFEGDGQIRNSLLRNRGDGTFDDVTRAAGLAEPAYPTQAGNWADFDLDGDLDLYVGNEVDSAGRAFPSQLFRNDGHGRFVDVAAEAGVTNDRFAKSVAWGDYDDDGDPDLYVSNIGPNRLYRNEGNGRFTDVARQTGTVRPEGRSFPTWFFDYDNDGRLDLFVADYGAPREQVAASLLGRPTEGGHPLLYRNLGGERFEEVSETVGLTAPCLPMGSNFGDLDNDGWLDFYLGTGDPSYDSLAPNLLYHNRGGRRFSDVTYSSGLGHLQKGHGVAFGDIDRDGDQDIFEQMGGAYPGDAYPSVLYENPGHGNAWITLRLVGEQANRSAIGARIRVTVSGEEGRREIHRVAGGGGPFGGSSLQQEIGLGRAGRIEEIEIRWPGSGSVQTIERIEPGRAYEIREGRPPRPLAGTPFALGGDRPPASPGKTL